ncbi:HlyD family efflux transporter periplasmic adaptor subunit [Shewanella pneumatophori]|uniref:Efflux RND transporter periplasmic adaptor subunit n=1 Tax=Shewanella pneumatophori TaxID=314092 RepID=A0A9X2CGD5_9GAMM|nr:HlyD family efflux transporter periplasmic adaptor subunit [Shewanella pneumatophori]MCL1140867.1 efflux RND transporter periplasmic adaptor subunit [Shewanella pneumatophori]
MSANTLTKLSLVHLAVTAVITACVVVTPVYASGDHAHEHQQHTERHDEHGHDKHDDEHGHKDEHGHDEHDDEHGHKDEHGHGDEHGHDEHEEGKVHITAEQMLRSGIATQLAQAGDIKQTVTVYGRAILPEAASSQVKARFAGLITQVKVNVGDRVKAGQIIAEVESNSSLKRYAIKAPISGVVVERNANAGEMASDNVLLSIIDDSKLWAEYQIFPAQMRSVAVGQELLITGTQQQAESNIKYLLSAPEGELYQLARAPLDNTNGQWPLGSLVSGYVTLSKQAVGLMIDNLAVQEMEGQQVIFVRTAEGFEKREVELGLRDSQMTEVLSGLSAGEEYAVQKSFLLKADLEKSSAGHVH